MDEKIKKQLEQKEQTPFHRKMLSECLQLVKQSRSKMSTRYAAWDRNDANWRNEVVEDAQDMEARDRKEPTKLVVPMSHAQINTFVGFQFSMFTQRDKFYELTGTSTEDHKPAKVGEALLERDWTYNKAPLILNQFLLDVGRFGLGIIKSSFVTETQKVTAKVPVGEPQSYLGMTIQPQEQVVEQVVTKFKGNRLINVSPYRFYPDTRLPLSRFQEGEFCASEEEYSYITLKKWEAEGELAGLEFVTKMSRQAFDDRGDTRLQSQESDIVADGFVSNSKGPMLLTEVQRVVVPNEFEVEDGEMLGEEDYPVKYAIWILNDQRVVKCAPMDYMHDQFTYDIGQYTPDMHKLLNPSLSDSIDKLAETQSWFINSRVANVRKVIQTMLLVDPEGVNMDDIRQRRHVIRMKPNASRLGLDRWIKQLDVRDVTASHIGDAQVLGEMIQQTTGITDNALGQFAPGRRSATEAKNVNAGATLRLKLIGSLLWCDTFVPLGEKMLKNLQQGLDEETMVKIVGLDTAVDGAQFLPVDRTSIIGAFDFVMYDGTLPTEKVYNAQVLQDILLAFLKAPQVALALQIDPQAILLEMMELRGIRNPRRFLMKGAPQNDAQSNAAGAGVGTGQTPALPGPQQQPNISGGDAAITGAPGPDLTGAPLT